MHENMNPKMLNELGDKYFYGINEKKNIEVAYTYYKQAADEGNPVGYYHVGEYFMEKKQYKNAIEYFNKAIACGYYKASLKIAQMAYKGIGIRKNKKKAFKVLLEAANHQDIDCMNELAYCYLHGIGTKKDVKKAWAYYKKVANQNHIGGMVELARLYLQEKNAKNNIEDALHWLDKASQLGSIDALKELKKIYQAPHPTLLKKSKTYLQEMIFYYDEMLANLGEVDSLQIVAMAYFEGTLITKINYEKSYKYFSMLTKMNHVTGHYGLGMHYMYGLGVLQDYRLAEAELNHAVTQNDIRAYTRLGDFYRLDKNKTPDFEKAKFWYMEASKNNEPEAFLQLGLLHYRKQIQNASNDFAFSFMTSAAKKDYRLAYYWLGIFYDKGIGTERNPVLAEKMFVRSIEYGNVGAKYKYAIFLYEEASQVKKPKKANIIFAKSFTYFLDYVLHALSSEGNKIYGYFYIGTMFEYGLGVKSSQKTARYWYELSAHNQLSKAMVKMYHILKETEFTQALEWLEKAIQLNDNGEAFYEMGLLYQNGKDLIPIDVKKARFYFEESLRLKHKPAMERLMMM